MATATFHASVLKWWYTVLLATGGAFSLYSSTIFFRNAHQNYWFPACLVVLGAGALASSFLLFSRGLPFESWGEEIVLMGPILLAVALLGYSASFALRLDFAIEDKMALGLLYPFWFFFWVLFHFLGATAGIAFAVMQCVRRRPLRKRFYAALAWNVLFVGVLFIR